MAELVNCNFLLREFIMAELARNRSAIGECIASFAGCFPVAFLEPNLKKFNKHSIVFGIEEDMIATHSLEAKGKQIIKQITAVI